MLLTTEELEVVMEGIQERIFLANRNDTLQNLLIELGCGDLIPTSVDGFESYSTGTIVVLGASEVKEDKLRGIAKDLGIDKKRLEFCLDYDALVRYRYQKLQYNPNYRVVLVGPAPHKTAGTGDYSNMITAMEQQSHYPKIVRLMAGNELKITKSNFEQALRELINKKFLAV